MEESYPLPSTLIQADGLPAAFDMDVSDMSESSLSPTYSDFPELTPYSTVRPRWPAVPLIGSTCLDLQTNTVLTRPLPSTCPRAAMLLSLPQPRPPHLPHLPTSQNWASNILARQLHHISTNSSAHLYLQGFSHLGTIPSKSTCQKAKAVRQCLTVQLWHQTSFQSST